MNSLAEIKQKKTTKKTRVNLLLQYNLWRTLRKESVSTITRKYDYGAHWFSVWVESVDFV